MSKTNTPSKLTVVRSGEVFINDKSEIRNMCFFNCVVVVPTEHHTTAGKQLVELAKKLSNNVVYENCSFVSQQEYLKTHSKAMIRDMMLGTSSYHL